MIDDWSNKLFKTPSVALKLGFPARTYIFFGMFKDPTQRSIPIERGYQGEECPHKTLCIDRGKCEGLPYCVNLAFLGGKPKSATGPRGSFTINKLLWGGLLTRLACGSVATGGRHELILKASIHAGDSQRRIARLHGFSPWQQDSSAFLIVFISLTVATGLYKPSRHR